MAVTNHLQKRAKALETGIGVIHRKEANIAAFTCWRHLFKAVSYLDQESWKALDQESWKALDQESWKVLDQESWKVLDQESWKELDQESWIKIFHFRLAAPVITSSTSQYLYPLFSLIHSPLLRTRA
jgi:hypothetical protein